MYAVILNRNATGYLHTLGLRPTYIQYIKYRRPPASGHVMFGMASFQTVIFLFLFGGRGGGGVSHMRMLTKMLLWRSQHGGLGYLIVK